MNTSITASDNTAEQLRGDNKGASLRLEREFGITEEQFAKARYINVLRETREYGGPEEGGWYYKMMERIIVVPIYRLSIADREYMLWLLCKQYKVFEQNVSEDLYSVNANGFYHVTVDEEIAPRVTPERKPHYE